MEFTRRNFGKLALATAAVPAGTLFAAKVDSKFNGVQIGTITYSYRDRSDLANDAHELLKLVTESGISAIELMPSAAERFAGAPLPPLPTGRGGGAGGGARGGSGRGGGACPLILRLRLGVLLLPLVHELEVAGLHPATACGDGQADPDRHLAGDERRDDDEGLGCRAGESGGGRTGSR